METLHTKRYHIIVDITEASTEVLSDENKLREFLNFLPHQIGMNVLHEPIVVKGIPENPGLSGFVIIDYSHISIHTFTQYHESLVDIFSCKPYDKDVVIDNVLNYFKVNKDQARIKEVNWG